MCLLWDNRMKLEGMGNESLKKIKKHNFSFIAAAIEKEVNIERSAKFI